MRRVKALQTEDIERRAAPKFIQIAPGRVIAANVMERMPEYHLATLTPDGNTGHYRVALVPHNLVRLSTFLKALKLEGLAETVRRLGRAGELEVLPLSPSVLLLNVDSWMQHLRRVAEAGDEYWTAERKRNYVRALR